MPVEYRRLLGAVLIRTLQDWSDPRHRAEIREFLKTPQFEDMAEILGLCPSRVRSSIEASQINISGFRAFYK